MKCVEVARLVWICTFPASGEERLGSPSAAAGSSPSPYGVRSPLQYFKDGDGTWKIWWSQS